MPLTRLCNISSKPFQIRHCVGQFSLSCRAFVLVLWTRYCFLGVVFLVALRNSHSFVTDLLIVVACYFRHFFANLLLIVPYFLHLCDFLTVNIVSPPFIDILVVISNFFSVLELWL